LAAAPLQRQITELDQHLGAIAYDLKPHTALRNALRNAQSWQLRHQELLQAQQHYPQVQQRVKQLTDALAERTQALQTLSGQIAELVRHLQQTPDPTDILEQLATQMQQRRTQMDDQLAHLGRLQQQQQHLADLSSQHTSLSTQLRLTQRQLRIHQELGQAFGKNGIQALMIENLLPQLEAETNQILGQITNHQLHVQFVTQRSRRRGNAANPKLIDTLDILIADAQGTRPYETYSGGEAFRINFAIRLALARLLAQRSGTALQLLIVDEGFGTQDDVGCDRLISAIQAIASDFACILTVTHMPRFKDAFQTHVEVFKTDQGSQLRLSF
jgi:exonuclease SbcC